MKKPFPFDFFYALTTLLLSFTMVHIAYTLVIRPNADAQLAYQREVWAKDPMVHIPRSIWVIMHDPEPETCWVLAVWAGFILGYREYRVVRERKLLQQDFLGLKEGEVIFPDSVREFSRQIENLPAPVRGRLLPRTLRMCMTRFGATGSVQHAAEAARDECELEASRLDAELSMIRFAVWAIPAVGFVGTVRGIGAALQEAQRAGGRRCDRCDARPRHHLQCNAGGADARHHHHVLPASDPAFPGPPGAGRQGLRRPLPHPPSARTLKAFLWSRGFVATVMVRARE